MPRPSPSARPGIAAPPAVSSYGGKPRPKAGAGLGGLLFWGVRDLLLFGGWVLPLSEVLHQLFRPDPTWLTARLPPLAALATLFTAWHIAPAGISIGQTYPEPAWIAGVVLVWATYGWVAGEPPVGTRAVEVSILDRIVVLLSIVTLGLAAVLYLVPDIGGLVARI